MSALSFLQSYSVYTCVCVWIIGKEQEVTKLMNFWQARDTEADTALRTQICSPGPLIRFQSFPGECQDGKWMNGARRVNGKELSIFVLPENKNIFHFLKFGENFNHSNMFCSVIKFHYQIKRNNNYLIDNPAN